ncbi:MAG: methyltransferase domain-containing protein [Chitinivibrionales bacterium]|nr:methyltransferase domain-containing protein [Chitinivibrionales bacterium]
MAQATTGMSLRCPLCLSEKPVLLGADRRRRYYQCTTCLLCFVPEEYHVDTEQEKERYAFHDNTFENKGYVAWMERNAQEIATVASPGCRILDFGCGEHAVLSAVLNKKGYQCTPFDPLYSIGRDARGKKYDMIVLCETIEHIRDLRKELLRLWSDVAPGGKLFVKTQTYTDAADFFSWWYKEDITHIRFFCAETFYYLENLLDGACVSQTGGFVLLGRASFNDDLDRRCQ